MGYPRERKEAVLKKMLPPNHRTIPEISKAAGKVKGNTLGLVKPTEKECIKCHNSESPSYKEFKFAEAWKKIEHNMPKSE